MRFSVAAAATTLLSVASVHAAQHNVTVGDNMSLSFNPTSITAAAGDMISFTFIAKNHSVTQSTFAAPCTKEAGGVDSGFMNVVAGAATIPQWTIQVNDTTPLWFFCAQVLNGVSHCGKGMVFAVNAPATKTFDQFQAAANATASNATTSANTTAAATNSTPSPTDTGKPSGALKLGGSAAGVMTIAALFVGFAL